MALNDRRQFGNDRHHLALRAPAYALIGRTNGTAVDTLGATIGEMEYGIGHLGVALAQIGGKTGRVRLPVGRI